MRTDTDEATTFRPAASTMLISYLAERNYAHMPVLSIDLAGKLAEVLGGFLSG